MESSQWRYGKIHVKELASKKNKGTESKMLIDVMRLT